MAMKKDGTIVCGILLFWAMSIVSKNDDSKNAPVVNNYITVTGPTATAGASNQSNVEQKSYNYMQAITTVYDDAKKAIPGYGAQVWQHRYKISAGIVCASWVYVQYKLHKISAILENPASWCNWKPMVSMQQLVCASHEELIPQLLMDIQKKYLLALKTVTSGSQLSSFDQCIIDISKELALLQWYLTVQKGTQMVYFSSLFYFSHKKSFIQEKINRLHVIVDIFISWQTKEFLK